MRSKARSGRSELGQARLRLVLRVFFMPASYPWRGKGGEREGGKGREGVGSNLRFSPSPTLAGDTPVQISGQSHGKGALAHAHVRTHIYTYAYVR